MLSAPAAYGQHAGDVWIGRSAAGQLKLSPLGLDPTRNYLKLNPVSGPIFWGWTSNAPGFDHITSDTPAYDVYVLQPGCQIWLEAVFIDAALRLIDNAFEIIDEPGESTYLGDHTLHVHDTWHINSQDPAYDPNQCVWRATFILRDAGSAGYDTSAEFTLMFTSVPWGPRESPPIWADGDFDRDDYVALDDFAALAECMNGPDSYCVPADPAITTCEVECVNAFDFGASLDEVDLDVDLLDFAEFQTLFTGSS